MNVLTVCCIAAFSLLLGPCADAAAPSFSRDVLPILSDNCFHCHGPDESHRKANLRLDTREGALALNEGIAAIVPGDPRKSELLTRILSDDRDEVMPPPKSHKPKLGPAQVEVLRRWIEAGAPWGRHWAFEKLERPVIPTNGEPHPIDALVSARLAHDGLTLSPEAPAHTLWRRVSLDLTGLPPSPEEAAALTQGSSIAKTGQCSSCGPPQESTPGAKRQTPYTAYVDRLLASEPDGERGQSASCCPQQESTNSAKRQTSYTAYVDRLLASEHYGERGQCSSCGPPQESTPSAKRQTPYTAYVDRLLASEHYGERMAYWWLDASRYADTDGFQGDASRTNWPWRDWVVAAFNRNQPFDQFTIEQFAGDLLPGATPEQKLATCFHRNHMTNGEGGRDPEESRVDYVRDRVNTVGTVWLGLTLSCAQCHTHKFDPITQADYYSLNAFFNSIDEDGKAGTAAKPYLKYESPRVERAIAEAQQLVDARKPREAQARSAAELPFAEWLAGAAEEVRKGFQAWHTLKSNALEATEGTILTQEPDAAVQASGPNPNQDDYRFIAPVSLSRLTGLKLEILPHPTHTEGKLSRGKSGEFILTDIKVQVRRRGSTQVRDIAVSDAIADFAPEAKARSYGNIKDTLDDDPRNGWTTKGGDATQPHVAVYTLAEPLVLAADEELIFELRQRSTVGDANIGRFRLSATDQRGPATKNLDPAPLEQLAAAPDPQNPDAKLRARLFEQFLIDHTPYVEAKSALTRAERQLAEAKAAKKTDVMVLAERKEPRATHVLLRGEWDKKGAVVKPDVPAAIAPWKQGENRSRLELAQWIVSRENPLTARVIANQLWQLCFGAGLVRTAEDFGLQGERPQHPELLDFLAAELIESGWNVKQLLRLIVTSRTYRQSSDISAALRTRDPENRLLARGARFRLPSWMLRDAALAHAGLLNRAVGGPPVKPYQPDGVWEEMFMGRFKYEPSEGAAQYRRTLYAFWRRAIAPTFLFDSAQRRVCEINPARTNTPLQALTLLNDASQREAALSLALEAGKQRAPIAWLFQRILLRSPLPTELAPLEKTHAKALAYYRANANEAPKFLRAGQTTAETATDQPTVAATALVASMILNLDEAITHE